MKYKSVLPILLLVLWFVIETYSQNELILSLLIIILALIAIKGSTNHKVSQKLFLLGTILGFFIESLLGLVSRNQYWNYGSLFGIPYWLPIAWGMGFVSIYELGKYLEINVKN